MMLNIGHFSGLIELWWTCAIRADAQKTRDLFWLISLSSQSKGAIIEQQQRWNHGAWLFSISIQTVWSLCVCVYRWPMSYGNCPQGTVSEQKETVAAITADYCFLIWCCLRGATFLASTTVTAYSRSILSVVLDLHLILWEPEKRDCKNVFMPDH